MTKPPIGDLKDLVAWQVAMDFAESAYRATRVFPAEERFGLSLQLRRSAVSIASNIAEGHGRVNKREYARFVSIARGSLKEAETQVLLAHRLRYLADDAVWRLLELSNRINRLLRGLNKSLAK